MAVGGGVGVAVGGAGVAVGGSGVADGGGVGAGVSVSEVGEGGTEATTVVICSLSPQAVAARPNRMNTAAVIVVNARRLNFTVGCLLRQSLGKTRCLSTTKVTCVKYMKC